MSQPTFDQLVEQFRRQREKIAEPAPPALPKFVKPAPRLSVQPPAKAPAPVVPGVKLGVDLYTGEDISIPEEDQFLNQYIIGQPGQGKTNLVLNEINQGIQSNKGICFIDPHGDASKDVFGMVDIPPEQVVLIDSADWQHPFGLNLFECQDPANPALVARTVDVVMQIFRKLWGDPDLGVYLYELLSHVSQTFIQHQGLTLIDVPRFLLDEQFRSRIISSVSWQLQEFWHHYDRRTDQESYSHPTLNKVRVFSDDPILSTILGQSKSTIDFKSAISQGKIIILRLPQNEIGEHGTKLIGMLVVNQLLHAMFSRTDQEQEERTTFSLYCDEFQLYSTPDFAKFFTQGRKFGFQVVVAHQERPSLDPISQSVTPIIATKISFRPNDRDIPEISKWFNPPVSNENTSISDKPIQQLLAFGHPNEKVRVFVKKCLLPLQRLVQQLPSFDTELHYRDAGFFNRAAKISKYYSEGSLDRLFDFLDNFLYLAMVHPGFVWSGDAAGLLKRIVSFIYSEQGMVARALGVHTLMDEEMSQVWNEVIDCILYSSSPTEIERNLAEYCQARGIAPPISLLWFLVFTYWASLDLSAVPIREASFDKRAYPGFARRDDAAGILSSLPKGQALIRYSHNGQMRDGILKTDKVKLDPIEVRDARIAKVKEYAYQHYLKDRSVVEQEIANRQGRRSQDGAANSRPKRPLRVVEG